ncbi:hypothetical protein [Bradyrhizobium manausense]|uniref:hypothetical protein n=1 Tax=Bradyrhizobium manausense TaxID=989370 RepID=UPI001BA8EA53|nr:hypothetical protein [Bradyrhizobium manausense]MBR0724994.1 hypothetical protein [Bradyrhizobium manausense]
MSLEPFEQRMHRPARFRKCLGAAPDGKIGLIGFARRKSAFPSDIGPVALAQNENVSGLEAERAPDRCRSSSLLEHHRRLAVFGEIVGCFDDGQFVPPLAATSQRSTMSGENSVLRHLIFHLHDHKV